MGKELHCCQCGKKEIGNISCPQGHYICDICHGKGVYEELLRQILGASSSNPFKIAEELMNNSKVPMLGCENAWIAAGAFLAAIKNEGSLSATDEQIKEALNRTRKQAIGGYCGLTGVCGIAPAIGACFSVILGAACPKDKETATTMKIVGKIVNAIAEQTGPCCCKNFVRTALKEATISAKEYLDVTLSNQETKIKCDYSWRHPHGCREKKCPYFKLV